MSTCSLSKATLASQAKELRSSPCPAQFHQEEFHYGLARACNNAIYAKFAWQEVRHDSYPSDQDLCQPDCDRRPALKARQSPVTLGGTSSSEEAAAVTALRRAHTKLPMQEVFVSSTSPLTYGTLGLWHPSWNGYLRNPCLGLCTSPCICLTDKIRRKYLTGNGRMALSFTDSRQIWCEKEHFGTNKLRA